jgi:hypothetical protein
LHIYIYIYISVISFFYSRAKLSRC